MVLGAAVLALVVGCSTTNDDVLSTYAPKFSDRAHALAALKPLVANATDRVPCGPGVVPEPLNFDRNTAANSGWYSKSMPTSAAEASNAEVLMDWQLTSPFRAGKIDDDPATSPPTSFDLDASANLLRGIQVTTDPSRFPAATRKKPGDRLALELDRYLLVSYVAVLRVAAYQQATFDPYEPGSVKLEGFIARIERPEVLCRFTIAARGSSTVSYDSSTLSQPDAALRSLRQSTRLELHTTLARLAVGEFTSS